MVFAVKIPNVPQLNASGSTGSRPFMSPSTGMNGMRTEVKTMTSASTSNVAIDGAEMAVVAECRETAAHGVCWRADGMPWAAGARCG